MSLNLRLLEHYRKYYAGLVDWFVYSDLARGAPDKLYQSALYIYRAGGKRFRPFVVMATARMLGGSIAEKAAIPFAAAVEIFHVYTLIHDDIMDEDTVRRGIPTTHIVYGIPYAILAGDLDHALSYRALLYAPRYGLSVKDVSKALDVLTEAAVKVAEGQAYDMMFEKMESVSYQDYLKMIYLKTSALIEASAKLGAIAGTSMMTKQSENMEVNRDAIIKSMGDYGKFVGLAFQIRDDILGVFGDPSNTGKPVYSDLRRGKKTILVLYAYEHSEGGDKELLSRVMRGEVQDEEELRRAAQIIEETGALSYAEELAESFSKTAIDVLDDISPVTDENALEALKQLALFAVKREK